MRTAAIVVGLVMSLHASAQVEVMRPAKTQILITPVACAEKALCNVFHIRYIKSDGIVQFSRDIPSAWRASNVSIEVRTGKGKLMIWSDR